MRILVLIFATLTLTTSICAQSKFDSYGQLSTDDEAAHLDNFYNQLQAQPELVGYLIGYNEPAVAPGVFLRRLYGDRNYLTEMRGLDASRLFVIEGGYRNDYTTELWVAPRNASPPTPTQNFFRENDPTRRYRFDDVCLDCSPAVFLDLPGIGAGLRFYAAALRENSNARASIVVRRGPGTSRYALSMARLAQRRLIREYGIAPQRIAIQIATARKDEMVTAEMWIVPSRAKSPLTSHTKEKFLSKSPCVKALSQRIVCVSANTRALEAMRSSNLKAVIVVQDVQTGALVTFAASHPNEVDATTAIRPLSLAKVLLAASWWDNAQPDSSFEVVRSNGEKSRITIDEMLVGGSDSAGRQSALALRKSVGSEKVLADFARYGFPNTSRSTPDEFWRELSPTFRPRLIPMPARVSLGSNTNDADWAQTLSVGEMNISASALHISRLMQIIGNSGVLLEPSARDETARSPALKIGRRVMQQSTASRLQRAMRETVQRGTARSIARALAVTGWQIGGKTGTGPALLPKGEQHDGWFAGLIFDPDGQARFTVATFVRSGGLGGENAAKLSAAIARYIIGA